MRPKCASTKIPADNNLEHQRPNRAPVPRLFPRQLATGKRKASKKNGEQ